MTDANYPPETRARAALRCADRLILIADEREAAGELDLQGMRADFLRVVAAVRRVEQRRLEARLESIPALLKLCRVKPEEFEQACVEVDAGERAVADEAQAFMEKLRQGLHPQRRPAPPRYRPAPRRVLVVDDSVGRPPVPVSASQSYDDAALASDLDDDDADETPDYEDYAYPPEGSGTITPSAACREEHI
jgi:septum formation topological specificity factor MinE